MTIKAVVSEFMEDTWVEYLGTLNVELSDYFSSLRPRYQTPIISSSFVGAREREQASVTDPLQHPNPYSFQ
jgi:hypothetical protein